ncbi:5'-nucleotidase-like [Amphiura filiformis]|uniref:5'-nucleotidase-like n=1 Tax=Amphiura filiformis TaxID=82378 RepID=UPI003B21E39B
MAAYFTEIVLSVFLLTLNNAFAYDLTILHTNDVHGRITQFDSGTVRCSLASANAGDCFGGAARIQTVVNQTRTEIDNVLLLDGGDQFQGTTWFHYYQGDAAAHFMNKIGYDAMAIGNHEFDLGPEVLARFLRNVNFDVVSANVDVSNETSLQGLFTKSVIKDVNGERIGIVGYTYRETPVLSHASVGATIFEDEVETVQREVDMLIDEGIDIIIALGHSGYEKDLEVAARVRGVDIVVGGHSDTFLYTGTPPSTDTPRGEYPTVVTQTHDSTRRVLVVQDYAHAKYLGRLDVVFNDQGEVVEYSGNPVLLDDTVEQDPDILTDISKWGAPVRNISNEVIGRSNVILQGAYETCCFRECNLGNLVTDAYVRAFVPDKASDQGWTNMSVAIEVCGTIRGSINQGDILFEDVVGVLPFQTTIDAIDIRGSDLKFTLETAVAAYDPDSTFREEFMQFSAFLS